MKRSFLITALTVLVVGFLPSCDTIKTTTTAPDGTITVTESRSVNQKALDTTAATVALLQGPSK